MKFRLFRRITELLNDPKRDFRERVFIALTFVSIFVAMVALIGDIIFGENIVETISLAVTVIAIPVITIFAIKTNRLKQTSVIVVMCLIFVLLPLLFYFGGGVEGGGVLWIIFAYLYTGLVLTGYWKPITLVVLSLETCGFYLHGYFHPEYVEQHDKSMFYVDSLISIILVGIVCCLMVWFVEWLFREENKRTREEAKKVEELNRAQSRFFSSMSHEIRTPINSILGLNEIILRQEDASEEIIKDAGNIQGAGRMLLALVNDILDISKIEAGKMDIIPINYELGSMLSEIVNMMWLRAEEKGLELRVEVDPSIPAELFGDEVRIKQILVNLLNNAVKYTKEGSVTLRVEKEDTDEDQVLLLFSVSDTGMGIKQDAIPYLFDAFQRVDEEKNSKIEGTGLGLSVVKQLAELMGGKVTVNSVYTQGSTFMVALWQKMTRKDSIGDIQITNYGNRQSSGKYKPGFTAPDAKILIVDDNEMNLEVEKKLLADTRMTIDTATSGADALIRTLSERYDIILMDHLMPEMDGIECMQNIRKQTGGLNNYAPVIVLTANAGSENRDLYNRSGFDGYLVKPVSGQQLEEMLLMHLPEIKVIRSDNFSSGKNQMNTAKSYSKKIPILVATSSMCDLPDKVLKESQIDLIPFTIVSDGKSFYDRIEASTDELVRYMKNGREFDSTPPSVEEFEKFFGAEMKKAHKLIYITIGRGFSTEYDNAKKAARAYENVIVFDSGVNSCAMGMLVLLAHRMSTQGRTAEKIVEELDEIRKNISCTFITGDSEFMMKRGNIGKGTHSFLRTFSLRPLIRVKDYKINVERFFAGESEVCYKKYIDYILARWADPDLDVLFVEYVELSPDEMEELRNYILRRFNFEHIIFQKASAVMVLNCGIGALGLSFIRRSDQPYSLSLMLALDEESDTYQNEKAEKQALLDEFAEENESGPDNRSEMTDGTSEHKWYEKIQGIDAKLALENSGSEETLKSVLDIFYRAIDEKAGEIEAFYDTEDWENYTIKVHALKSSARLVGAAELASDAEKLEFAGKEGNVQYIVAHTRELLDELNSYKPLLAAFCEQEETEENEEEAEEEQIDSKEQYDRYIIDSAYDAMESGAELKDPVIIGNVIKEMADYAVPETDKKTFELIKVCLDSGDYEKISDIIATARKR